MRRPSFAAGDFGPSDNREDDGNKEGGNDDLGGGGGGRRQDGRDGPRSGVVAAAVAAVHLLSNTSNDGGDDGGGGGCGHATATARYWFPSIDYTDAVEGFKISVIDLDDKRGRGKDCKV